MRITHENSFQTIGSTHMKTVLAFNKREKRKIEKERDVIII
jgi:hypothetical protein